MTDPPRVLSRIGVPLVSTRPDIAQCSPQQEDLDIAESKADKQDLWVKCKGSLAATGPDLFSWGVGGGGRRNGFHGPPITIPHSKAGGAGTHLQGKEKDPPDPACHPPAPTPSQITHSRTGEMIFNVRLCFQLRQSAKVPAFSVVQRGA